MKIILITLLMCLMGTVAMAACPVAIEPPIYVEGTYKGHRTDFSGKEQIAIETESTVIHVDTSLEEVTKFFDPDTSVDGIIGIMYQPSCKVVSGQAVYYNTLEAGRLIKSKTEVLTEMDKQSSIPQDELSNLVATNTLGLFLCAGDTRGDEPSVVCSKYSPNKPSLVFQSGGRGFLGNLAIKWRIENNVLLIDTSPMGKVFKFQYLGDLIVKVQGSNEYYIFQSRK